MICELCEDRKATKKIRRGWCEIWICNECICDACYNDLNDIKIEEVLKDV